MPFHQYIKKLFEELISHITVGFIDEEIRPMNYEDQVEFFSNTTVQNEIKYICKVVESYFIENYEDIKNTDGCNTTYDEFILSLQPADFREHIYGDIFHEGHVSLYSLYKPYEDKMRNLTTPNDELDEMLDNRKITFDEFFTLFG